MSKRFTITIDLASPEFYEPLLNVIKQDLLNEIWRGKATSRVQNAIRIIATSEGLEIRFVSSRTGKITQLTSLAFAFQKVLEENWSKYEQILSNKLIASCGVILIPFYRLKFMWH